MSAPRRRFLGSLAAAGLASLARPHPLPAADAETFTLTNPSPQETVVARIRLSSGAILRKARATVLTHEDMHATNAGRGGCFVSAGVTARAGPSDGRSFYSPSSLYAAVT